MAGRKKYVWERRAATLLADTNCHLSEDLEIIGFVVANHEDGEGAIIPADSAIEVHDVCKCDFWSDALSDAAEIYNAAVDQMNSAFNQEEE